MEMFVIFLDAITLSPTSKQRKTVSTSSESPVPSSKTKPGGQKKMTWNPYKNEARTWQVTQNYHLHSESIAPYGWDPEKRRHLFPSTTKMAKSEAWGTTFGEQQESTWTRPPKVSQPRKSRNPVKSSGRLWRNLHPTKILMFCSGIFFFNGLRTSHSNFISGGPIHGHFSHFWHGNISAKHFTAGGQC